MTERFFSINRMKFKNKLGIVFIFLVILFLFILSQRKRKESLFQDIWYINMDKSTERRTYMEKMLRDLNTNLEINRWPAVNGHLLTEEDYNKLEIPAWARPGFTVEARQKIRKGEIGCYLSHKYLMEYLNTLSSPADKGHLILEDDIKIADDFFTKANTGLMNLPSDWDIVTFGIPEKENKTIVKDVQNNLGRTVWMNNDYAYLVKHSSLPKILNEIEIIREPIDTTLGRASKMGKLNIYSYVPPLVKSRENNDTTMNGQN